MPNRTSTQFFMTHHSPFGAWSSLTFGLPGHGVSIDHECSTIAPEHDLIIALLSDHDSHMLPFVNFPNRESGDVREEGARSAALPPAWPWRKVASDHVSRQLQAASDTFTSPQIKITVFTPVPCVADPEANGTDGQALCPAVLLDIEFDNSSSDAPAAGLLGLRYRNRERIRPLDWSMPGELCGIGLADRWALAARPEPDRVFTLRHLHLAKVAAARNRVVHNSGNDGGIMIRLEPRERAVLTAVFGFHRPGIVTQGIRSSYWHARHFDSVEDVCRHALLQAPATRALARIQDEQTRTASPDARWQQIYAQSVRGYMANTQLTLTPERRLLFNVCEGKFLWRNTLDLAIDHAPFELAHNRWTVRNILDCALDHYSYRDEVDFAEARGVWRPGGLAFTHDMGSHSSFSPAGASAYELGGRETYGFMTTEELLNGCCLIAAYILCEPDTAWGRRRLPELRALVASIMNRDHHVAEQRNGLLKGRSSRCAPDGIEITTYDALDEALLPAEGSTYLAVKTWCAGLMLAAAANKLADASLEKDARACALRTASSLEQHFNAATGLFPAIIGSEIDSAVLAVIEPLAVPYYCGLEHDMRSGPALWELLVRHAATCLTAGRCIDRDTGGVRLSSNTSNTWPSKVALSLFVAYKVLGLEEDGVAHRAINELLRWTQVAAAEHTIADQIDASTAAYLNGANYPRIITSFLWLRPRFSHEHATANVNGAAATQMA